MKKVKKPKPAPKRDPYLDGIMKRTEIRAAQLTPEQRKEFQRAARRTWQAIGSDILHSVADSEGKDVNRVTMKRAEVIEVVLDADHLTTHGGTMGGLDWKRTDPLLYEFYHNGNHRDQERLLREVFSPGGEGM